MELISREAAIEAIDDLPNCYNGYSDTYDKAYIIGVLEEQPTIDPVVRCGECKFYDNDFGYCVEWQREKPSDWFCADGERREE